MKICKIIPILLLILLITAGCNDTDSMIKLPGFFGNDQPGIAIYALYMPERVEIIPLTMMEPDNLKVYVRLIDQFDSQIKAPGTFRFEVFEFMERSAQPRGDRVAFWPEIELIDPMQNNQQWADFLRAYLFEFPFEPEVGKTYIVNCFYVSPVGQQRLESSYKLNFAP